MNSPLISVPRVPHRMFRTLVGILISLAILMPDFTRAAQTEPSIEVNGNPEYHMIQLTIEYDERLFEEFVAQTQALRSCDDARRLSRTFPTRLGENKGIKFNQLPKPLRDRIKDTPTGRATAPFGREGQGLRVLVVCERKG